MLKEIFHYIYCMSIPSTITAVIVICSLWNWLCAESNRINKKQLWQSVNRIFFVIWFVCVLYMTIIIRGSVVKMNLIPFTFIVKAIKTGNEEFFRTGWMNVLLFIPGGMWLFYGTKRRTKAKQILQIIFLIFTSISIETVQWYYQLGTVETDDVLCNTFGAIIGATSFIWAEKLVAWFTPYIVKLFNYIKHKINPDE